MVEQGLELPSSQAPYWAVEVITSGALDISSFTGQDVAVTGGGLLRATATSLVLGSVSLLQTSISQGFAGVAASSNEHAVLQFVAGAI